MRAWIHWIGNAHYTPYQFIKEARKMGVSRRIPPHILKQMSWGDRIYCATREPGKKNPVVFGYFILESLVGIQVQDMPEDLKGKVRNIEDPGLLAVERGCGYLVVGGYYCTTNTVEELAKYTSEPNVRSHGLKIFPKPWPVLQGMKPFRGFRPFDDDTFLFDLEDNPKPRLKKFYYVEGGQK